ncbi:unnamed protein product [Didymodactylos carnosus]|uniref:Uncharacterized protein n=1 Tax=Didymodactylos carnosus TaxID=1234261 RepID=A0A815DZP0_9BILA|nr:unnamed protein product [Didymodactylos carnosus]CAF1305379.1 unnamed protein product [Didymodactylos carnosus]CAF3901753.1 unnamed protein product [Didymodactylos carnosus]CAF4137807.1 unnamed protein product [Didymodactylos carnosus]
MYRISINNCLLLLIFLVTIVLANVKAQFPAEQLDEPLMDYKRLGKYCYIHNFELWNNRQKELTIWVKLSKLMKLNLNDHPEIQKEMEQYRLQYECLKILERMPIAIGPGR